MGKKLIYGMLASAAAFPTMAAAQEEPAPAPQQTAAADEEDSASIIVTAQRYEQRLIDVPLSVSAISAEEIERRNVTSLDELQYSVPGLSAFEYGPGQQFVQIRGVSTTLGSSTVGIYLDETPVAFDVNGNALSVRLIDMERVEVLRGPQPTLYGEGSMGGTIRYIPAAPDLDAVGGSAEGELSFTEDGGTNYLLTGVINAPIVADQLGVRLVAGIEHVAGWIDSNVTGEQDVNDTDIITIRGSVLAQPSDTTRLSVLGIYQDSNQDYINFGVDRQTNALVASPTDDDYGMLQLMLVQDFGFAELTAIGSYLTRDTVNTVDLSPFYVPVLTGPPPFGFGLPSSLVQSVALTSAVDYEIFYGEARLASTGEGPLRWLLGATYRDVSKDGESTSPVSPGPLPFDVLSLVQTFDSESFAIYGEVGYQITPRFQATVGLRYFEDQKAQTSISANFGVPATDINQDTFHSWNPRINLSYNFTDNSMVYANAAKGFRSGGFNLTSAGLGIFPIPPSYDPDQIWTYEVGTKHQLLDGRLTLEGAVYYSDWTDVQTYAFAPGSPLIITLNSGEVSGWGVDLSASARPVRGLTLSATFGWNNLEFQNATADKLPGDPVDGAVQETWSASADYRTPIGNNVAGFIRADYQHAGDAQLTLRNFGGQIIERPGRDLVNLRLGVELDHFEISVFANNVFDEDAPNIIGPFGVFTENQEQRPRVIGINARTGF